MKPIFEISTIPANRKTYNGNTRKFGITIDNTDYIVKFPKDDDLSVYCEYIASNFLRKLGVSCHEVFLGSYKGIIVDLIKDFTSNTQLSLHSYKDTKQSSEDTEIGDKEYTYNDVLYLMDKHLKMTDESKQEAKERFWEMFICDAMIGNRDRHWGNWGYLSDGKTYRFAPLYDNGAGLYPGVNHVIHQYADIITRKKFLYDRVFVFPASLFKIQKPDRSYRSNYAEMFRDTGISEVFREQVEKFKRNISYQTVFNAMKEVCDIVPLGVEYRRFYIEITTLRYMCIVLRLDFERSYEWVEGALTDYA
ncbi:MAG: hypothetical protein HFG76_05435 [Hungatella sp.]|jgi:hypothetical protein|nr:hypothetical protein [Hungatella sp.]